MGHYDGILHAAERAGECGGDPVQALVDDGLAPDRECVMDVLGAAYALLEELNGKPPTPDELGALIWRGCAHVFERDGRLNALLEAG